MRWLNDFDLFLFDLDGLLIDSESLHWRAYQRTCEAFGHRLDWDFQTYLSVAGSSATAIQERLREEMPALFEQRSWQEIYTYKQKSVLDLLMTEEILLMKGAEYALEKLATFGKPLVVVTHSSRDLVEQIRKAHPSFAYISDWISREEYVQAKPAPDGYLEACLRHKVLASTSIGFEDSMRGVHSLLAAGCQPVLINSCNRRACQGAVQLDIPVFSSFFECIGE